MMFNISEPSKMAASNTHAAVFEPERPEHAAGATLEFDPASHTVAIGAIGPYSNALRRRLQGIARAEMARPRPPVRSLTVEQKSALEALLVSTANRISDLLAAQLQRAYEAGDVAE